MGLPSERQLKALAQILYEAIILARARAWECAHLKNRLNGRKEDEIADLLDVIHNIPDFLTRFEEWDDEVFLRFLDAYDRKWSTESRLRLREVYERALQDDKAE